MAASLLNGIALVIDDEINDKKSEISKMLSSLEKEGTFFIKTTNIPTDKARGNLSGISFIILDWDIKSEEQLMLPEGVLLAETIRISKIDENNKFIREMLTKYFVPIFIFSQQEKESIHIALQSDPNIAPTIDQRVFIESKSELKGEKIKSYLEKWLKNNKTVLTLKMFEEQLNQSKNNFLVEMGELATDWVRVVYQTLSKDYKEKGKPLQTELLNAEFNGFLLNSMLSRFEYADYSTIKFTRLKRSAVTSNDVQKIYESIKFYAYNTPVNTKQAYEGDLYQREGSMLSSELANEFFVNINAPCDLRSDKILLVKGILVDKLDKPKIGETKPTYDLHIFMGKTAIQFKFRNVRHQNRPSDLSQITIGSGNSAMIYKRIGRITHPYITAIRNEYAHFISRQGVPRHP
jgi:hypothetical protein